jgi:hypothetical protein
MAAERCQQRRGALELDVVRALVQGAPGGLPAEGAHLVGFDRRIGGA